MHTSRSQSNPRCSSVLRWGVSPRLSRQSRPALKDDRSTDSGHGTCTCTPHLETWLSAQTGLRNNAATGAALKGKKSGEVTRRHPRMHEITARFLSKRAESTAPTSTIHDSNAQKRVAKDLRATSPRKVRNDTALGRGKRVVMP